MLFFSIFFFVPPSYESDINGINVLLVVDAVGNTFTGKIENLSIGLFAMQRTLGWTNVGKIRNNERVSLVCSFC